MVETTSRHGPPLVSVLLPAYNCEATLAEAVTSMTAQTLRDIEVIVVDDGSTDNTGRLLDELAAADPRIRPIHTANRGIVEALNTALAAATGEFVARMDADDRSRPDRLALQVDHLRQHPQCVCVGSLFRVMDVAGRITSEQLPIRRFQQTDLRMFPPRVTTLPHPTILLRRRDLIALHGYRHGFAHAEDNDLFLRLAERGSLGVIQAHLLDYRVHQGSVSSRNLTVQVDSALRALLCALFRSHALPEPQWPPGPLPVAELTKCLTDRRLAALLNIYRDLRVAEAEQMRVGQREAAASALRLMGALWRRLPSLAPDRRYWALQLRLLKFGAKVALRRI